MSPPWDWDMQHVISRYLLWNLCSLIKYRIAANLHAAYLFPPMAAAGLTLHFRRMCNRDNDAPKQSASSSAIWWCQQLWLIWPTAANRKSPAIDLINQLPFWFNTGVSYLEPLYGTVGDPMKGATWSRSIFFSSAKWCDTSASHFVSQRWLWMLKTGNILYTVQLR